MKRREFVASLVAGGLAVPAFAEDGHDHHRRRRRIDGALANATVSFGAWDPPYDRLNPPPGIPPNVHRLIPYVTTIKAGGAVNFIVAGLHQIVIYGRGKRPQDVDTTKLVPIPGTPPPGLPPLPPLIDDEEGRIYRGLIPLPPVEDRTEVVHFEHRGLYLVICAVLPHFQDNMYGWVRVVRG